MWEKVLEFMMEKVPNALPIVVQLTESIAALVEALKGHSVALADHASALRTASAAPATAAPVAPAPVNATPSAGGGSDVDAPVTLPTDTIQVHKPS